MKRKIDFYNQTEATKLSCLNGLRKASKPIINSCTTDWKFNKMLCKFLAMKKIYYLTMTTKNSAVLNNSYSVQSVITDITEFTDFLKANYAS